MIAINRILPGIVVVAVIATACSSYSGRSFLPQMIGYQEKLKEVFVLGNELLEISGINYLGGDSLAAINDEKGELFFVYLKKDSSTSYKFKGKGDYEDLVKTDSGYYILDSQGDLFEVKHPYTDHVQFKFPFKRNIEFESIVFYKKNNKLLLISKDQRKPGISAFTFDLATKQYDTEQAFYLRNKDVFLMLQNFDAECKPSAAAIHPVSNKLFIIASIGKLLLECTPEGNLEKIYKLNPAHFPQPEGISFATNGDMYISNEGLDGKATILKFPNGGQK